MGADLSGQGRGGLVLAVFGPTASGKSAVAEALAERIPSEVVSADSMQAYRGLPILTNQPARPTRLVGIWPLDHEGSVGEYQRLAHVAVDEVFAAGADADHRGGHRPLPARRARRARLAAGGRRQEPASAGSVSTTRSGRRPPTPSWPSAIRPRPRLFIPTTAAASCAHSSWPWRASLGPRDDRLWTDDTRRPTLVVGLDVPAETLNRRIGERTRAMVAARSARTRWRRTRRSGFRPRRAR